MKHGFIKVAAVTPDVKVADVEFNGAKIREAIKEAAERGAKVVVFPELALTAYTCGDLFLQELLLNKAKEELARIAKDTADKDMIAFVGLPLEVNGSLYNVAAVISRGEVLAFIPKSDIPDYGEFSEGRYFAEGPQEAMEITWLEDREAFFGTDILFSCEEVPNLMIGVEVCEDLWTPVNPSQYHALAGATVMVNLSASNETTGKDVYRRSLIEMQSAKLVCGYICANAGEGESTTDLVFAGGNIIAENGTVLAEAPRFHNRIIYTDLDVNRIRSERRRMKGFDRLDDDDYIILPFNLEKEDTKLDRRIEPSPFIPENEIQRRKRCEEIFMIQAMGLKKRLVHTGCKSAVIGISGGLDSTLALLVMSKAFELAGIPAENMVSVTMPGFGTTDRTYTNACTLTKKLGARLMEVSIRDAVTQHFKDIGHDINNHDVTYENSQARERTQILMDIANQKNGMVIGTGDMSELALGWATYNGDHMSMYGVNASVPKTLVRHLVRYYAEVCTDEDLKAVLLDILDTPVSPELLPPKDGKIAQKTEDLVGPYELHDFFMYQILRFGFEPKKVYRMAQKAFEGVYDHETILKWLKVFYRRFFSQQFKRSCLADGPKVGSVGVSPRGDLRMPSDACAVVWQKELENL